MKPIVSVVGILAAGVVGALAGQVLFPAGSPEPAPSPGTSRLTARLDELAREVALLRDEVDLLRDEAARATPAALPPPKSIEAEAAEAAREDFDAAAVPDDLLEEKVRETVEKIAADARAERARKVEEATRKKERAWLDSLRDRLDLTDYQVEELGKLLVRRRHAIAAIKAKWAEQGDAITEAEKAALRKAGETLGQRLDEELQKLLSTSQYESLEALREERRRK